MHEQACNSVSGSFDAYSSLHSYCQNWPEQHCTVDAGQTQCGNLDTLPHPSRYLSLPSSPLGSSNSNME